MSIRSEFLGFGSYVPKHIVTNFDLEKKLDTSDEWIQQRSGIQERRWVKLGEEATLELAVNACNNALADAGKTIEDIDCIIAATLSPPADFPGLGCFLGAALNRPGIAAYDIRQQCSAWIYATEMADALICKGLYKNILVVGSEVHSKGIDKTPKGRNISVLFGDGAGAAIMSNTGNDKSHFIDSEAFADGTHAKELWNPMPANVKEYDERIPKSALEKGLQYPYMNGKLVFMNAVRRMSETVRSITEKNQIKLEDVDLFIFHQANLRINQKVGEMLGIDESKVFNTIQKYANTTAATIPLTMDEARKAGKLKKGMLVVNAAFGSGFTWGSTIFRY